MNADTTGQGCIEQRLTASIPCPTTLEADVRALRQVPMFRDVDTCRLKLLAFTSERLAFGTGQRLFSQGDPSDAAYVILEGRAEVVIETEDGTLSITEVGPGALVGEMGVLCNNARSASIVALEPTTVLRTDRCIFMELLFQFPQLAVAVMRELVKRVERTNTQPRRALAN